MNGKGKVVYEDGRTFVGTYVSDFKHGEGIYTWPCGKILEGKWINGKQ